MTEELLKRLEDTNSKAHEVGYGDPVNPDGPEAAALIRQLKADKERMRSEVVDAKMAFDAIAAHGFGFAEDRNAAQHASRRAAQSLNQTERGEE